MVYENLIAYYPFTGNALDRSGNGYDGVVTGATLTTDRFGTANEAYNIDGGASDGIVTTYALDMSKTFTLSFWIKVNSYETVNSRYFSSKFNTYGSGKVSLEMRDTRKLIIRYSAGSGFGDYSGATINANVGKWTHVVWNHNEASTHEGLPGHWIYIYKNGVLLSRGFHNGKRYDPDIPTYSPLKTDTGVFTIGNLLATGQDYDIDDVRIYDKALSDKEVKQLYNDNISVRKDLKVFAQEFEETGLSNIAFNKDGSVECKEINEYDVVTKTSITNKGELKTGEILEV